MKIKSVSVIVPAIIADRATEVTVEHLLSQQLDNPDFEVVVVSPEPRPPRFPRRVRWERLEGNPSAANARNRGMRVAKGELFVFLDADMIVEPAFVAEHVRAHESSQSPILFRGTRFQVDEDKIGQVMSLEAGRRLSVAKSHSYRSPFEQEAARFFLRPDRKANQTAWVYCITANLSILKKHLLENELEFDPRFQAAGCEDTDFAFRAHRAGIPLRMDETAFAWHIQACHDKKRGPDDLRNNIVRFQEKYRGERLVQSVARQMLGQIDRGLYQNYLYGDASDEC